MIPDGANVTYTGQWATDGLNTSQSVISDVSVCLQKAGLPVRSFTTDASYSTDFLGGQYSVTLHLQVENGMGFGKPDDIISLVRHCFYLSTGFFPSSDSLPYAQQAVGGNELPTGQPAPPKPPPGAGCISGTSSGLDGKFSISCWFSNLTTKGLTSVGFIALLVLLGFGLLIFARPAAVAGAARRAVA